MPLCNSSTSNADIWTGIFSMYVSLLNLQSFPMLYLYFLIIQPITMSYLHRPILQNNFFILFNLATFLLINNLPCNFIKHTASTPDVHFITVVTICKKTFRCPIPAGRNIFCIRLFRMYAPTGSKISKLEKILLQ